MCDSRDKDARAGRYLAGIEPVQGRIAITALLLGLAYGASMMSCTEVPQNAADRVLTATVTLSNETAVLVDSPISLEIQGRERLDEIHANISATVTASTSTRARALADALEVIVDRSTAGTVKLLLAKPDEASLGGTFALELPSDLAVQVLERGGTTRIDGVRGKIDVQSLHSVGVNAFESDVSVATVTGNAIVVTELDPGSTTIVQVDRGDIELDVPEGISVDLQALVTARGQIIPNHPRLPPFFGGAGQTYQVDIGGGLAIVRLTTNVGNIVIRSR